MLFMKDQNYIFLLAEVKSKIQNAQIKAVLSANSQMLFLYWQLGNIILENQKQKGWGAKIISQLSIDLKKDFPNLKGFSTRNLMYMKQFATTYTIAIFEQFTELENLLKQSKLITQQLVAKLLSIENQTDKITQQAVAQNKHFEIESLFLTCIIAKISWSHHIILLDKEPHLGKRLWYALNTIENGISRNILAIQIESNLFERQFEAKKINNFKNTLPPAQSDFADYLFKDPYIFDFVQAKEKADERNIEEQLAHHITKFLLELGQGFSFEGRQVHFEIGEQDFYADLLFYHTKIHAYVVVELKARPFEPKDTSQLNFYVNVINDKLKTEKDNDTIGLLLCKGKNEILAEYSLKGNNNAIGISDYQISKIIPEELKSALPQIDDITNELKENNYIKD